MILKAQRHSLPLFIIVSLAQICCGQPSQSPLTKERALRDVKLASVGGWVEAVSDKGRFRILFPGDPVAASEGSSPMEGFKLINGGVNWFAYYVDLSDPSDDEVQLRERYRQSIERIARNGSKLVSQRDIFLNNRLGAEFVLEGKGAKSFMRGILVKHRFYILSVDVKGNFEEGNNIPKDIRQFFDSFTFWE